MITAALCTVLALGGIIGPLDDDEGLDAWGSVGIGIGLAEREREMLAAHVGVTARMTHMAFSARYSGQTAWFLGHVEDLAILAGPFLRLGEIVAIPQAGVGRTWGQYEASIFDDGTRWGPDLFGAYQLQLFLAEFPWVALTIWANDNKVDAFGGVAISANFGSLMGEIRRGVEIDE